MNKTNENSGLENTNLKSGFANRIIAKHALTDTQLRGNPLPDYKVLKDESLENIQALEPKDNLQLMLASQMASVHNMQQRMMIYASNIEHPDTVMKYVNNITKLSNVFIQQVNLMKKLKGEIEKKVIIEHVHVHSGAQAVVGTVHTSTVHENKK